MKRKLILLSTGLLFLSLLFRAAPEIAVRGEPNVFIIQNADATNTLSLTVSVDLGSLISNIAERFIIDHANASNTLFLSALPSGFLSAINLVEDRFVIDHANKSNTLTLGYPVEMIGDTTAPSIVDISSSPSGSSLVVSVTTAEYTTAEIQYGLTSGSYPYNQVDDLYQYTHEFSLPGLDSGEVYYYRLVLTDRSDNVTYTPEATLEPLLSIYLPALVHH